MNFRNLIFWIAIVITTLAGVRNIDSVQRAIWKAHARIIYESRTETWGSPKFLRGAQLLFKAGRLVRDDRFYELIAE